VSVIKRHVYIGDGYPEAAWLLESDPRRVVFPPVRRRGLRPSPSSFAIAERRAE
jgi:hypothetical protein